MPSDTRILNEKQVVQLSDPGKLNIYSLVLCAADITHRVEYSNSGQINIYVPEKFYERAKFEIAAYDQENLNWPYLPPQDTFEPRLKVMSLIVVSCLACLYSITGSWADGSAWFVKGAGDSTRIITHSEYYRLITSLSLHADITHLLSNCLLGGIVLHYYLFILGNGLGLTMLTITAAIATLVNVLGHGSDHHFVGFSTAIFAVMGMLCTIRFIRTRKQPFKIDSSFLMPVMAGLALLAFLGSSGVRTDLGAHLFGLICGFVAGNVVRLPGFNDLRDSLPAQISLSILPFLLFLLSWMSAFRH